MKARRGPAPYRLFAVGAALALVAAGLGFTEGGFFAAALPLAAWAALGLFAAPPEPLLVAERRLDTFDERGRDRDGEAFSPAGEKRRFSMTLKVHNRGERLECLSVEDDLPPGVHIENGSASWRGSLDAGAMIEIAYVFSSGRGLRRFEGLDALAIDPLSAVETRVRIPASALAVVPPLTPWKMAPSLAAHAVRPFSGESRVHRQGGGTEFAGTREYAPGDPLRSLNWRAEARFGQSVVNIHEEERALDVGIILDARAEAYEDEELFEKAVQAALAMALALLDGGNRVAFLSYGSLVEWTAPGLGREQRLKITLAAARSALGDHAVFERFDNLPVGLFPPRSSILLISPLLGDDLLPLRSIAALGYSLSILRLRPRESEEGAAPVAARPRPEDILASAVLDLESSVLVARLARAGVEVSEWDGRAPLDAVLGRRSPGKRRQA